MNRVALALLLAVVSACDSRATASDRQGGGGARAEQKSREFESCGASLHCQDTLRCFDHVCRRTERSALGDYWSAVGAAARTRGELESAIAAYARALGHYDAEKLSLPPEIDCAYGATLAAAKTRKDHAELGARVLHRCVLAVPVGSALRDQAFAQLATLHDVGLDPVLLSASKTADLYLTKQPARPSTDKLAVTLQTTPPPAGKTVPLILEKLGSPDVRAPLIACWEAYNETSKKVSLAVAIPIKSSYKASQYEDEPGVYSVKLEDGAGLGGAEATADACVRQVVEPAIKGLKISDAFSVRLALTIK